MKPLRPLPAALALIALTACSDQRPDLGALGEPQLVAQLSQVAPPGARPGSCWGKDATPAVIETVTHRAMLQPAEVLSDGTIVRPPIYKTETRQDIVRPRRETWFETPCKATMTPEFIASVQRALAVRGHFHGTANGEMDARTRAAVRRYQAPQGLDSGILSLAAARALGLVAMERDRADGAAPAPEQTGPVANSL